MTVHVGIVSYNSIDDLPRCFAGLAQQQNTVPLRITVYDNASADGSAEWVAGQAAPVRLIRSPLNRGFAAGHNAIISASHLQADDFYLPLNPDVWLEPDYIQTLVNYAQEHHLHHLIGKLRLMGHDQQVTGSLYSVGHALLRNGYVINIGYQQPDTPATWNETRPVFGASGAAPLLSAAFIETLSIGSELFDEDMFMYGEDSDLDWRAQRAGIPCWYVATAVAYHRISQPNASLRLLAVGNRYLSVIKNAFGRDLLAYNLPLIAMHCMARILLHPPSGLRMTAYLLRRAPRMARKRQRAMVTRADLRQWFDWAVRQPTGQPLTLRERIAAFWRDQQRKSVIRRLDEQPPQE